MPDEELTDQEKTALEALYNFYVLWQFEFWKQKMPSDEVSHEDYQALVAKGLAQQKDTPMSAVVDALKILQGKTDAKSIASKALLSIAKAKGMLEGDTIHEYQINQAGIDLWKSYGIPSLFETFFGTD